LFAGPTAAIAVATTLPEPSATAETFALSHEGGVVLGLMAWMAIWWLFQAVPIAVTALLPVALLPVFGVGRFSDAAAPYASDVIFLFAGGCLLATAIDRHGLGRRFATAILSVAGRRPAAIVGAFVVVTAALSAVVSNTATVAIVLPLAAGAVAYVERHAAPGPERDRLVRRFTVCLLLAVAYAANIGGCLTIVGSPPNAIGAKLLSERTGEPISFLGWMRFGAPVVAIMLPTMWLLLTSVLQPLRDLVLDTDEGPTFEAAKPMTLEAWFTLGVFLATVAAWVSRPYWPGEISSIGDWGVATIAALLLLCVPLRTSTGCTTLGVRDLAGLPWGVFILFGGGISLAVAMKAHGVDGYLGSLFTDLEGLPPWLVVAAVVAAVVFLTEITSNTAVASAVIPVLLALAATLAMAPSELVLTVAVAASLAFMLPVGTPPNALVFSTGRVPVAAMIRCGLVLNLVAIVVITGLSRILL
jgi:sodium-dependent dicarboxylate transporter 2/3/5